MMTQSESFIDDPEEHFPDGIPVDSPPVVKPSPVSDTFVADRRRNEAIDVVRQIAAAGIIFIHAVHYSPGLTKWTNFFRFAVPFYLFASLYFQSLSLRRRPDRTLLQYVAGRAQRLYLPFLAWSIIYLLMRDAKRMLIEKSGPVDLRLSLLWSGTEYHLWFLPFLLGCSIVLALIYWVFLKYDRRWRWPMIALAIAAGWVLATAKMPGWNDVFDNPQYATVQFWRALPAACWAMAFAWFMTMGPVLYRIPPMVGMGGLALAIFCSVRQVLYGLELIPRALSGLGCMLAAMAPWSASTIPTLAWLGRYSYGIYLCHVLVIEVIHVAITRVIHTPSTALDLTTFALSLAGSLALVILLGRSKRLAWLNG